MFLKEVFYKEIMLFTQRRGGQAIFDPFYYKYIYCDLVAGKWSSAWTEGYRVFQIGGWLSASQRQEINRKLFSLEGVSWLMPVH